MNINHKNIYNKSKKDIKDLSIKSEIEKTFESHPAYGHRRLALKLKMNKKKILRVMHKFNLKPPRLWYQKKFTTYSDLNLKDKFKNLLKDKHLTTINIGDVWSSDLTYIKYQGKFLYLVIIQDIVLKEVVAFNLSDKHNSNLVLKTLKEAVLNTKITPKIFHSDRGQEFLSQNCIQFLESLKIKISVSDPASPWQNSWSESFFSRFKCEFGPFSRFENLGELIENIYQYLNYYNTQRIQLKIKMSPYQFKQKVLRKCS
ncbi:MAG: IS3 family transposase [Minisyncoccia bacterium]